MRPARSSHTSLKRQRRPFAGASGLCSRFWALERRSRGWATCPSTAFPCSQALLLAKKQARLPADALGRRAQLLQRPILNLANPFLADPQQMADLPQAVRAVAGQAEAEIEDAAFARPQVFHEKIESFLALRVLPQGRALIVGHRLGQFEITVVVEDCVQRDRSAGSCLQVGQVFEPAAGARGQFLWAG